MQEQLPVKVFWGEQPNLDHEYRARVVVNDFDWGDHADPVRPIEDLIIYELHVRGFTKDASSEYVTRVPLRESGRRFLI